MTTYFGDTSALAKRYLNEVGSSWVRSWILPTSGHVIILSNLAPLEMFSLLARKQHEQMISAHDLTLLQNQFLLHVTQEYIMVELDPIVLTQARLLINKHPLRTLDALQLSCAQNARSLLNEPITFVSGDNRLLIAAAGEGFATDNPYLHP